MTSPSSQALEGDPLASAVFADRSLWNPADEHPDRWLAIRNNAVREAVTAGYTNDDIARALGVLPSDVERILRS